VSQRFRAGVPVLGSPERTRQYQRHRIGMTRYHVSPAALGSSYRRVGGASVFRC
jgi:hypothetical protein